jgi:hypothetical protein
MKWRFSPPRSLHRPRPARQSSSISRASLGPNTGIADDRPWCGTRMRKKSEVALSVGPRFEPQRTKVDSGGSATGGVTGPRRSRLRADMMDNQRPTPSRRVPGRILRSRACVLVSVRLAHAIAAHVRGVSVRPAHAIGAKAPSPLWSWRMNWTEGGHALGVRSWWSHRHP